MTRRVQTARDQASCNYAKRVTRNESLNEYLYRYAMPQKDFYDTDFPLPKKMPKHEVKPGTVWYHASDSDMEPGTILQPGFKPTRNDYSGPLAPRQHQVFMTDDPYYASAYGRWLYEIEPQGEGPYPWNGGVDEDDDGMPPWAASSAKVIRKVPLPWERAAFRTAMPRQDAYDRVTHEYGYAKEPPTVGEMDQTPVRPGPWYHSSDSLIEPGTVLDPLDPDHPNKYNYWSETLLPRDRMVFMHHDPAMTETYGKHLYEVEPMVEGPYAYNGEDKANGFGDGYASPKARVKRRIVREDPSELAKSKDFADAMEMMASLERTAMPVGGEIHRGLTLDMDAVSPQMRKILTDYGPESPEFITELLRHGTGTYWSRDRGFAEGVNPGNGLQVALSADWDGNGAQPLHNENLRKLPDSWGDMSLLAPSDNTVAKEFNLKPGKELDVKSIRVKKKDDPGWRELLRQPTRARTARLHIAMPTKIYRGLNIDTSKPGMEKLHEQLATGGWEHPELGSHLLDSLPGLGGHWSTDPVIADRFARWPDEKTGHGGNMQAVIEADWDGSGLDPDHTGTREFEDGQQIRSFPWESEKTLLPGTGVNVTNVRVRPYDDAYWNGPDDGSPVDEEHDGPWRSALSVPRPHTAARSDAYDKGKLPPEGPDQTPVRPGPWYHSTDADLAVGDVLDPTRPNNFDYGGVNPGWEPRDNWVFMDNAPNGEYGHNEYVVEPLDEGPYPWNGNDSNVFPGGNLNGYASPRARVVQRLPKGYAADYYQKNPQLLETDYGTDKAAMVLGMCTVDQLVEAATYYHHTDRPDFKLDPGFTPENLAEEDEGSYGPGVFLSSDPELWADPYSMGERRRAVPFEGPDDLPTRPGVRAPYGDHYMEFFVPSNMFDQLKQQ